MNLVRVRDVLQFTNNEDCVAVELSGKSEALDLATKLNELAAHKLLLERVATGDIGRVSLGGAARSVQSAALGVQRNLISQLPHTVEEVPFLFLATDNENTSRMAGKILECAVSDYNYRTMYERLFDSR